MSVVLTSHDEFLWHTLRINDWIDAGHYVEIPTLSVMFAPMPDDLVWAAAPFRLYSWGAPGDGSYVRNNGFFFATGTFGLALTAGAMIGRAVGNNARRQRAVADSMPRWMLSASGSVFVSNLGFYLATPRGLYTWTWGPISSMQLVQPGQVSITGTSEGGQVHWLVATDAAELLFTLWARVRHPSHPQFSSRAWLDAGWFERMNQAGRALPPNLSGRWWARGNQLPPLSQQ
jgi:hypothetical protein